MHAALWDIFASDKDPQSLWFGYQLAQGLTKRGYAARLFTDNLTALAGFLAEIDPTCWIQTHRGVEVADWRLADHCVVASTAVQVLGTHMPPAYLERMAQHPTPTRCIEIVAHDASLDPSAPLTVISQRGTFTRLRAQFGEPPSKAGHVKSRPNATTLRKLWTKPAMRQGVLQALGLRSDLADGKLSVFFDVRHAGSAAAVLEALAAGPREVCLFMDKLPEGWDGPRPDPSLGTPDRPAVFRYGAAIAVPLPARRWFLTDELIWASDLVMTTQGDIAARACESGTPLIWSADDGGFFNWYASGSRPVIRRALAAAFDTLSTGTNARAAWANYLAHLEDVQALADQVAQRVLRAPDLVDVLIAGLSGVSDEALERLFAPTIPGAELV